MARARAQVSRSSGRLPRRPARARPQGHRVPGFVSSAPAMHFLPRADPGAIVAPKRKASLHSIVVVNRGEKLIVDNRRARHDYHLLERVEAGLVLTGTEVKSLREGRASLARAYADIRDGEAWLVGAHISAYDSAGYATHDPDRDRKLLLHRRELDSLGGKVRERGLTLVPTRLYFRDGRVKVELALARGKELRDKRRDIATRDAQRQIERELKSLRR